MCARYDQTVLELRMLFDALENRILQAVFGAISGEHSDGALLHRRKLDRAATRSWSPSASTARGFQPSRSLVSDMSRMFTESPLEGSVGMIARPDWPVIFNTISASSLIDVPAPDPMLSTRVQSLSTNLLNANTASLTSRKSRTGLSSRTSM